MAARIRCHGVEGRGAGILAGAGHDILDLGEFLPQHLFLVEAECRVVGCHGEKQQEFIPRAALVELQPIVIDDGIDVGEGPEQDPGRLSVGRPEQSEGDQKFAAHHLVRQVGEAAQVGGVVGLDLGVAQRVIVLAGQVLQAGAQEPQLQRDAQVQEAAQELHTLRGGQLGEPAVHAVPLQPRAPLLHHGASPPPGPNGAAPGAGGGEAGRQRPATPRAAPSALPPPRQTRPPGGDGARRRGARGAAPGGGQGRAGPPQGWAPGEQARTLRRGLAAGSPPGRARRPQAGLCAPASSLTGRLLLSGDRRPAPSSAQARPAALGPAGAAATTARNNPSLEGSEQAEEDDSERATPLRGGGIPR